MKKIRNFIAKALYKPYKVFLLCLLFLTVNLILNGSLLHVFRLYRDLRIVQNRIEHIEEKDKELEIKIQKASDPDFVETELRQRLDYTGEGDLIFIFPENM